MVVRHVQRDHGAQANRLSGTVDGVKERLRAVEQVPRVASHDGRNRGLLGYPGQCSNGELDAGAPRCCEEATQVVEGYLRRRGRAVVAKSRSRSTDMSAVAVASKRR